jgi:D-serine deaminase-like pyridoxal phosphate-dependent protein
LIGGAALAGGTALALGKSSDLSGPRQAYFLDIQQALLDANIAQPSLVIDRTRLNANIDQLMSDLPDGMGYRIVSKSLPSLELLAHIRRRSRSDRLMTFNLPMLLALSKAMPEASQLLGKPLPAQAVRNYYAALPKHKAEAAARVQWLVDTPTRLAQYAQIADAERIDMAINIELDIGLHRGGVEPGPALTEMLETIRKSNRLRFAGFMGYEPHLAKLPTLLGWQERAKHGAWELYAAANAAAAAIINEDEIASATRNAAGSPTYRLYKNTDIANEISVGSALVKPTDFDTDLLADFQPAAFIATPVIKALEQTRMPGVEFADGAKRLLDPNLDKTIFIYGGNWMAHPEDPPGLRYNRFFGRSSNQEMLNGGAQTNLQPDDFVFLRPSQSEAVFLQFGDIIVYDNGAIVDRWTVFPSSA